MADGKPNPAIEISKEIWQETNDDDLLGLSGEVAYNLLLALFPSLLFVAALAGFIGRTVGVDNLFSQILGYLSQVMPPSAVQTITQPLLQVLATQSGGLLSVGFLGTLWAASNATATMMKAFNRAYGVKETRPFWQHRLLIAVGLTLLLGVLVLATTLLFIFGEPLGAWVAGLIGAKAIFLPVWNILRWPLIVLALALGLAVLYWLGPNVKQSFRWLSPGSAAATLLWLVFTGIFSYYVNNFGGYDKTYGAIAGVIVLLLWLNYSSFVFLVGVEINQVVQKRHDPRAIHDLAAHPAKLTEATRREPLGAARQQATADEVRNPDAAAPGEPSSQTAGHAAAAAGTLQPEVAGSVGQPHGKARGLGLAALGIWTVVVIVGVVTGRGRRPA